MNGRWFLRAAAVLILLAGAALLGMGAYQAGLSAGLAADGAVAPPPAGYGWYGGGGFGLGFLGFLGTLLFVFLLFGLLRAAFWGGPGRWREGGDHGRRPWEGRARDAFETWHREAHHDGTTPGAEPRGAADGPTTGGSTFGRG